jgi:predicted nucleic acid-binding protein
MLAGNSRCSGFYEVISVMAASQKRGTLSAQKAHGFFEDLRMLDIEVDRETSQQHIFVSAHSLAVKYRLTGYDAAYLELALRKGLPLASLDEELNQAAVLAGFNSSSHEFVPQSRFNRFQVFAPESRESISIEMFHGKPDPQTR